MNPRAAPWLLAGLVACSQPVAKPGPSPSPTTDVVARPATPSAAETARLKAHWMRTDADYMIAIDEVGADGTLLARYLNPRPINVARATWERKEGRLQLLVELRDRNYPGSYYELTYDPASDGLYGTYHHLGLGQDFDVSRHFRAANGDKTQLGDEGGRPAQSLDEARFLLLPEGLPMDPLDLGLVLRPLRPDLDVGLHAPSPGYARPSPSEAPRRPARTRRARWMRASFSTSGCLLSHSRHRALDRARLDPHGPGRLIWAIGSYS